MSGKSKASNRGVAQPSIKAGALESAPLDSAYLRLIKDFPLRPIGSETELDRAVEIINGLLKKDELTSGEDGYLDILSDLVETYETEHHPIPDATGSATLRFFLDQWRMTPDQLSEQTGMASSIISGFLSGTRTPSRQQSESLGAVFHVEPDLFLN
jgi:HTH-type transcriptional regulator/antitoxin HigA